MPGVSAEGLQQIVWVSEGSVSARTVEIAGSQALYYHKLSQTRVNNDKGLHSHSTLPKWGSTSPD